MEQGKSEYYQILQVYKNLIRKKDKRGDDSQALKKRLLALMLKYGKNKSTYSV